MNNRIVVFADLDDTLMQTTRKCPTDRPLFAAAISRAGAPLSFFTQEQQVFMNWLDDTTVVPVTARTSSDLLRVKHRFRHHKIVSHGALILDRDDRLEPSWLEETEAERRAWTPRLIEAYARVTSLAKRERLESRCRLHEDMGHAVYVSIILKDGASRDRFQAQLANLWEGPAARLHVNGRNMALLPPFASKARAVSHLMRTYRGRSPALLFIGIGDSLTDLPFMQLCHYAVVPRGSQIMKERLDAE